jgi:hypothetical protein
MHQIRFHHQQQQQGQQAVRGRLLQPLLQQQTLLAPLPYMLRMAIQPISREIKLTSDRLDAFANTLMCLICLDQNYFQYVVTELVGQQIPSVQVVLMKHMQVLCTDRQVNMLSIEKKDRQVFVQNFREFMNHVRSLPLR